MEPISQCNLCGNTQSQLLFTGFDRLHEKTTTYNLVICRTCGLIYLTPRPSHEDLPDIYPTNYFPYQTAIQDEKSIIRRLDRSYGLHKRCRIIAQFESPGKILDVGCATGIFLDGMRQRGWDTYGVEPSAHAVNYAKKRFGLNIFEGYLEEANFEKDFFDVITLWDVLEHVPDPRKTFQEITKILRPGGLLILSLPNPESWECKWFGKYWAGWDIPRHFHLFTRNTLKTYLSEVGLQFIHQSSFLGGHGVMVLNIQFWMTEWRVSQKFKDFILRLIQSIPARIITFPFFLILYRLKQTSIMIIHSRKKL